MCMTILSALNIIGLAKGPTWTVFPSFKYILKLNLKNKPKIKPPSLEVYLEPCQTSKMGLFVKIVNDFAKGTIINIWPVPEYTCKLNVGYLLKVTISTPQQSQWKMFFFFNETFWWITYICCISIEVYIVSRTYQIEIWEKLQTMLPFKKCLSFR